MLINITLTEQEQDVILGIAGQGKDTFFPHDILTIADKIRRARQDLWVKENLGLDPLPEPEAMRLYRLKSTFMPCGLCGVPEALHPAFPDPDARPESDHAWIPCEE